MTTVFKEIGAGKPHTHVFVVGVGEYPYLLGGKGPILDSPMGLRQLTSPPISAKAFADWILKHLNNPAAPLGSVELLLSPAGQYLRPKDGKRFAVKAATMENIKAAFDKWYDRCNLNQNNVAILYFCGHGVEKEMGNPLLLTEDFGKSKLRRWENAIDFNQTYLGMAQCQAKVQCYFIDACRQTPQEVLEIQRINATPLIHSSLPQPLRESLKLFATSTNQLAYGLQNQVTRFTDALINSLNGLGSKKERGKWLVTTGELGLAVTEIIEKGNQEPNTPQQKPVFSGLGTATIHVCNTPPSVPVTISLNPTDASNSAELSLLKEEFVKYKPQLDLLSQKWKENALADTYKCRTHFPHGKYHNPNDAVMWVLPPCNDEQIDVIKL